MKPNLTQTRKSIYRIRREREEHVCVAVGCCIIALLAAATLWALCVLIGNIRETNEMEKDIAQIRMDRAYLTGGRQ